MANATRSAAGGGAQGLSCAQNPGRKRTAARLLRAALLAGAGLLALAPVHADETLTYSYDARGRLKQVAHSGTVNSGVTSGYTFDGADNRVTATVSGVAAPVSFSIAGGGTVEGGQITFTVTRSTSTGSNSVSYATADGSAHAGTDYTGATGTLNFTAGQTTQTFTVSTTNDTIVNGTRNFSVNLSNATGGATIGTGQATGSITDNDGAPVFSIGPSTVSATEGQSLSFTITRSGAATGSYSVNYATANGTATAGSDYNANSGTWTSTAAGTQTVTVSTIDDTLTENNETFTVNLSSPSGGSTIAGGQGTSTGTIFDNDPTNLAVTVPGGGYVNLRSLASNYSNQTSVVFTLPSGSTVTGGAGGVAIDTGSWPAGVSLTLNVAGTVLGGGGNGGKGGGWNGTGNSSPTSGGSGGDAISCGANFTIAVSGTVKAGGGGGGGGGYVTHTTGGPGQATEGGGGGGGGQPNGVGGTGGAGNNGGGTGGTGGAGTTSGGGTGGTSSVAAGGNGGIYANAGSTGVGGMSGPGIGGAAGYAVRKNSTTCTASGNITGTVG